MVQKAVEDMLLDQKIARMENLMTAISAGDRTRMELLDHPQVTFVLRACLRSVVDGQSHTSDHMFETVVSQRLNNIIYIYIYMYTHVCMYIYRYMYIIYTCVRMYACMCVYNGWHHAGYHVSYVVP